MRMIRRLGIGLVVAFTLGASKQPPTPTPSDRQALLDISEASRTYTTAQAKPLAEPENAKIRREQDDLEQQRIMARTSQQMLWMTLVQIILGIVGTVGLLVTLRYARQANDQARIAAEAATDATKKQLRAYLVIKLIETINLGPNITPGIRAHVVNCGTTPALNYRANASFGFGPVDTVINVPSLATSQPATIAASAENPVGGSTLYRMSEITYSGLSNGTHHMFLWLLAEYEDIFGDKHQLEQLTFGRMVDGELKYFPVPIPIRAAER